MKDDTMPAPPGMTMETIKQRCAGFETPSGFMILYDPQQRLGCVWRPDPGLWTAFKPVEPDAFMAAAKMMVDDAGRITQTTDEIIRRMMHRHPRATVHNDSRHR